MVSERSLDELKDSDENDLSNDLSRSLMMAVECPPSCDSGIDRSISYGQIMDDDAAGCDGDDDDDGDDDGDDDAAGRDGDDDDDGDAQCQSLTDQRVELTAGSNRLQEESIKPSSLPDEADDTKVMEIRMSTSDSGFVGSNSVHGQTPNDDDGDDGGGGGSGGRGGAEYQSLVKQEVERTSNLLQKASVKPTSLSDEVYHTEVMESKMSASESGQRSDGTQGSYEVDSRGHENLAERGSDASPTNDECFTTTTICEKVSSTATSTSSTSERSSTSTPKISVSDGLRTVGSSTSTSTCETTTSKIALRDASPGKQSSSPINTNVPSRTLFSTPVPIPETSSSTAGKLTLSETSLVDFARSSSTGDKRWLTSEYKTPPTTASTMFVRSTSSTPRIQEPPRRRVVNPVFLTERKNSKPKKPPMFVRKMRNVNVVEGKTATFEVRVDGNPVPSLTWYKNGVELAIDSCKYSVDAEEGRWSLVIYSCNEDDKAEYSCTAVSNLGKITSRSYLVVEPAATD